MRGTTSRCLLRHVLFTKQPPFTQPWVRATYAPSISKCAGYNRILAARWVARQYVTKVELRPYQEECIQAVLDHLANGEKRLGVSLATGSGKTVIFSHLIERVPAPNPNATQTLILAHRQELVEQAANHCRNLYPDKTVEIEMGKSHASGFADITVASVASLSSSSRLEKFDPSRFKLLLVDEAHHIVASTYIDVLEHFNLSVKGEVGQTALVGVSATFSRLDGLALGKAVDYIVYHKDYVDMINEGWLANATFTTVRTGVDLSNVEARAGDFQIGALSKAVNSEETNAITVRVWLEKAKERRSTLVFCVDIAHVNSLTAMFRQYGIDARSVTGSTPSAQRANILEAFRRREFPLLVNCGIYTEGTDIPNIDCIVLARPTKSRTLLVQMVGRGLRLSPGKSNCHIIDMVASIQRGIVTTPTLFGLDPDVLVEEQDVRQMTSLRGSREAEKHKAENVPSRADGMIPNSIGNITFTDYDNVDDYLRDTDNNSHIRRDSRFAWVCVNEDKYVLSNRDGSYLVIQNDSGSDDKNYYRIKYYRRLPVQLKSRTPYARHKHLGDVGTLQAAVNAADTFASKKFIRGFIDRSAFWRKGFANQGHLDFLNKLRGKQDPLQYGSITSGAAADWITRLRHGAKGRFSRIEANRGKAVKEARKDEEWRKKLEGLEIRVGPVQDLDAHTLSGKHDARAGEREVSA